MSIQLRSATVGISCIECSYNGASTQIDCSVDQPISFLWLDHCYDATKLGKCDNQYWENGALPETCIKYYDENGLYSPGVWASEIEDCWFYDLNGFCFDGKNVIGQTINGKWYPLIANCGEYELPIRTYKQCKVCNSGYILNTLKTKCTVYNCQTMKNFPYETECQTCTLGYHLENSNTKCVVDNCSTMDTTQKNQCSICNNGYHLESSNTKCVVDNCQTMDTTNTHKCSTCNSSYHLESSNTKCIVDNCQTMDTTNKDQCSICNNGYHLENSNTKCVVDNCQTMDTTNTDKCSTCNSGYHLESSNTKCVVHNCQTMDTTNKDECSLCNSGYQQASGNTQCKVTNCQVMSTSNTNECQTCNNGYHLESSKTECYVFNCQIMDTTNEDECSTCKSGYELTSSNKQCKVYNCQTMSTSSLEQCSSCNTGYSLISANTVCKVHNCQTMNTIQKQECQTCISGYELQGSNDECNIYNCQTMNSVTTSECLNCLSGYELTNSNQNCFIQNCQSMNPLITNECQTCKVGYKLSSANLKCDVINCLTMNLVHMNQCQICNSGYILMNSNTACIIPNCQQMNSISQDECSQCNDGFELSDNKLACKIQNCQIMKDYTQCETCKTGYVYKQGDNTKCIVKNCQYMSTLNPVECSKCISNYNFVNGNKKVCQIENCLSFAGEICVVCNNGYYLYEQDKIQNCLKECPSGYFKNKQVCSLCSNFLSKCKECDNADICNKCQDNVKLYEGKCVQERQDCNPYAYDFAQQKCVSSCDVGYFIDYTEYICEKCSNKFNTGCSLCIEAYCIKCAINYLDPITKKCIENCQIGQFADKEQHKCIECSKLYDKNCIRCSKNQCEECANDMFLDSTTQQCLINASECSSNLVGQIFENESGSFKLCQKECEQNFQLVVEINECQPCHESCFLGACSIPQNSESCSKCKDDNYTFIELGNSLGKCVKSIGITQQLEQLPANYLKFQLSFDHQSITLNNQLTNEDRNNLSVYLSNGQGQQIQAAIILNQVSKLQYSFTILEPENLNNVTTLNLVNTFVDSTQKYFIINPSIQININQSMKCSDNEFYINDQCSSIDNIININFVRNSQQNEFIFDIYPSKITDQSILNYFFNNIKDFIYISAKLKKSNGYLIYSTKISYDQKNQELNITILFQNTVTEEFVVSFQFFPLPIVPEEYTNIQFRPKSFTQELKVYLIQSQQQKQQIKNFKQFYNTQKIVNGFTLVGSYVFCRKVGSMMITYFVITELIDLLKYVKIIYPLSLSEPIFNQKPFYFINFGKFLEIPEDLKDSNNLPSHFKQYEYQAYIWNSQKETIIFLIVLYFISFLLARFKCKKLVLENKKYEKTVFFIGQHIQQFFNSNILFIIIILKFVPILFAIFTTIFYAPVYSKRGIVNITLALIFGILLLFYVFFNYLIISIANSISGYFLFTKTNSFFLKIYKFLLGKNDTNSKKVFLKRFNVLFEYQSPFSKFRRYFILFIYLKICMISLLLLIFQRASFVSLLLCTIIIIILYGATIIFNPYTKKLAFFFSLILEMNLIFCYGIALYISSKQSSLDLSSDLHQNLGKLFFYSNIFICILSLLLILIELLIKIFRKKKRDLCIKKFDSQSNKAQKANSKKQKQLKKK